MSDEMTERPGIQFDHHTAQHAQRRHQLHDELRSTCPMGWSDSYGGFWVASRHADIDEALHNWAVFSSAKTIAPDGTVTGGNNIPPMQYPMINLPLEVDPPVHREYRTILNPELAPAVAEAWATRTRQLVTELLDAVIESGRMEVMNDLATQVTPIVVMEMLGLGVSDRERMTRPFHEDVFALPGTPEEQKGRDDLGWVCQEIGSTAAERRAEPRDDMLSRLTQASVEGGLLSDQAIVQMAIVLIGGAADTTGALIGSAVRYLSQHPADRSWLAEDPTRLVVACEEFLRYFSPAIQVVRTATVDTMLGGQCVLAGDRVLLSLASANRDDDVFQDADRVILDRHPNRHAAFSLGVHRCVGSNVARMVFRVVMEEFLRRLGDFEVIEDEVQPFPTTPAVAGWARLPITFRPGARLGV